MGEQPAAQSKIFDESMRRTGDLIDVEHRSQDRDCTGLRQGSESF